MNTEAPPEGKRTLPVIPGLTFSRHSAAWAAEHPEPEPGQAGGPVPAQEGGAS